MIIVSWRARSSAVMGGRGFPEISEAMDGRREAHRDVLVAVSGKPLPPVTTTEVLHASGLDA
jgi:hypothetical protein